MRGVDGELFFLTRRGGHGRHLVLFRFDDDVELRDAALKRLDFASRILELTHRRLRAFHFQRGLARGLRDDRLLRLLPLANGVAQRRPRLARGVDEAVDRIEIGLVAGRRGDARRGRFVSGGDVFRRRQQDFRRKLHRLKLGDDLARGELEDVVVVVGE